MKKVVITGGGGLLGQYLNIELAKEFDILSFYRTHIGNCAEYNSLRVDITDFELMESSIQKFKPDFIVHTAAVSNPDKAGKELPATVNKANVEATERLAVTAKEIGARLIYTSTDLVYAGYRGSFLDEAAKLVPMTIYAETKLIGEQKIQNVFDNYVILRTPLLLGMGMGETTNKFNEMCKSFLSSNKVKLFSDQYRTPLAVREAARIIRYVLNSGIKSEIINIGCEKRVSRVEIGEMACKFGGFSTDLIDSVTMDSVPNFVQVADVSFNISKLKSFGIIPKSLEEMIEVEVKDIINNYSKQDIK